MTTIPSETSLILVTRPMAQARATAERLRMRGLRPWLSPSVEVEALPLPDVLPRDPKNDSAPSALAVTSMNAITALRVYGDLHEGFFATPAFAVGDATAEALREAGFTDVTSAKGDREALAALLQGTPHRALYLATAPHTGAELAALLPDFSITRLDCYRLRPMNEMLPATLMLWQAKRIEAVLLYSALSARAFVGQLRAEGLADRTENVSVYCLSAAVALEANALSWRGIHIASAPDEAHLLDLLAPAA